MSQPPVITSNGGGATAAVSVPENTVAVTTVTATNPNGVANLFFFLSGPDASKFQVGVNSGVLTFKVAPDYEAPTDVGGDNVYNVTVRVSDGTYDDTQAIAVTVTNVDESPVFTTSGPVNVYEEQTAAMTVQAVEPSHRVVTYSIVGGDDAALFAIDATFGTLTFVAAPNFNFPTDANADSTYVVTVRATSGATTADQTILVNVLPNPSAKYIVISDPLVTSVTLPADFNPLINVFAVWGGGGGKSSAEIHGSGGGACSVERNKNIAANTVLPIVVGAAGATSTDGGDTSIDVFLLAKGGKAAALGAAGQGGQAASGTGSIKFSGGNGGTGVSGKTGNAQGGGGGAGGTRADGTNSFTATRGRGGLGSLGGTKYAGDGAQGAGGVPILPFADANAFGGGASGNDVNFAFGAPAKGGIVIGYIPVV